MPSFGLPSRRRLLKHATKRVISYNAYDITQITQTQIKKFNLYIFIIALANMDCFKFHKVAQLYSSLFCSSSLNANYETVKNSHLKKLL